MAALPCVRRSRRAHAAVMSPIERSLCRRHANAWRRSARRDSAGQATRKIDCRSRRLSIFHATTSPLCLATRRCRRSSSALISKRIKPIQNSHASFNARPRFCCDSSSAKPMLFGSAAVATASATTRAPANTQTQCNTQARAAELAGQWGRACDRASDNTPRYRDIASENPDFAIDCNRSDPSIHSRVGTRTWRAGRVATRSVCGPGSPPRTRADAAQPTTPTKPIWRQR